LGHGSWEPCAWWGKIMIPGTIDALGKGLNSLSPSWILEYDIDHRNGMSPGDAHQLFVSEE